MPTKSWKNHPQKLLRILKSTFFSLLPWLPKRPRFSSPFYKKLNRFKTRKTKNVTDVASASFGDLASMKKKNRLKQKIKKKPDTSSNPFKAEAASVNVHDRIRTCNLSVRNRTRYPLRHMDFTCNTIVVRCFSMKKIHLLSSFLIFNQKKSGNPNHVILTNWNNSVRAGTWCLFKSRLP